jgi:hypothetical protein
VNATTDGVVRPPSAFGTTTGSPPSMIAMHEFVVPKSIPSTLDIFSLLIKETFACISPDLLAEPVPIFWEDRIRSA